MCNKWKVFVDRTEKIERSGEEWDGECSCPLICGPILLFFRADSERNREGMVPKGGGNIDQWEQGGWLARASLLITSCCHFCNLTNTIKDDCALLSETMGLQR